MSRTTYEQYVQAKINTGATPEDTVASLRAEFPAITLAEAFQAIRYMTAIVSETSQRPQANTPGKTDEVLLNALGSNLGTELGGESVVENAAYQAWLLCQAFPDENALAIAESIKDFYPSLTLTEMAQVLKHNSLHPVFPEMKPTEMATTLVNPALGSATFSDVAVALHSPGVDPQLEADEMGQVLKTPSVFPNISIEDMSAALKAAGYVQAEIDSAIAQLFSLPVVGLITDGAVLNFDCLGNIVNPQHVRLDGRTEDGSVTLAPATSDPFIGTKWRAYHQGNNVFAFACLGNIVNPDHVWLVGRTEDNSVGLAPITSNELFAGASWEVVNQGNDTYALRCQGNVVTPHPDRWLNGRTEDGSVGLGPITSDTFTGTKWKAIPLPCRKIGPVGITVDLFGDPFDDTDAALNLNQPLIRLSIRSGNVLDSIQAFYGSDNIPLTRHGGPYGDSSENIILGDDYITKVSGSYGDYHGGHYILQLVFQTKSGKIYGPYGNMGDTDPESNPFSLEANDGEKVIALFGTAGVFLSSIGITVVKI